MTLGRALIGLWMAASLCWMGAWSWYYRILSCGPRHEGEAGGLGWHCDGPPTVDGQYYLVPLPVMAAVIVGIPVATLLAGIALRGIAQALRRDEESRS